MASALFLGYGFLLNRSSDSGSEDGGRPGDAGGSGRTLLKRIALDFVLRICLLIGWAIWAALKLRGWRRAIPLVAAIAVVAAVHWTLDHGYRGISYASLSRATHVN